MDAAWLVSRARHHDITRDTECCPSGDCRAPEIIRTDIGIWQLLIFQRCLFRPDPCFSHSLDRLAAFAREHEVTDVGDLSTARGAILQAPAVAPT